MTASREQAKHAVEHSVAASTGDASLKWMRPVVEALDHTVAERLHDDPFQRDPETLKSFLPYLKAFGLYSSTEIRGWENLPSEGPFLIVGNHSGGAESTDTAALCARWIEERGAEAPLYSLAYDLIFGFPVMGPLLPKLGIIPANQENARKALAQGADVLVFPGGDYEVFRDWTHRNRIEFGGHKGFIELAIAMGVPVVPMIIHGAHESTFALTRGEKLARRLGLDRLHVKSFPIQERGALSPRPLTCHSECLSDLQLETGLVCPSRLFEGDRPLVSFGIMGGDVQAQAHVQFVSNLVDHGLNVQEALDAPRFNFMPSAGVALEDAFDPATHDALAALGHDVQPASAAILRGGFGGGQAIATHPETGVLWAGSDRRKDGLAAGY